MQRIHPIAYVHPRIAPQSSYAPNVLIIKETVLGRYVKNEWNKLPASKVMHFYIPTSTYCVTWQTNKTYFIYSGILPLIVELHIQSEVAM